MKKDVIFKFLDKQKLIKSETNDTIYYFYNENDICFQIVYEKTHYICYVNSYIISLLNQFFDLNDFDLKVIITEWVESRMVNLIIV